MAARAINRLSARGVQAISEPGRYNDGDGLYLVVDENRNKRWIYRYRFRGSRTDIGLGSLRDISLAKAREIAAEVREKVRRGIDPQRSQNVPGGVPTFGEMAELVITSLSPGWRGRVTESNWRLSLEKHAEKLGKLHVDTITTEDVLDVVKPLWTTKPESGGKLRERIERVLDAAKAKKFIASPWENPARWRGHLEHMLPKRKKLSRGHHRALPYQKAPAFMAELRKRTGMGALALEWTILSAAREAMTLEATWSEIQGDLWVVPGSRMKEAGELVVPITEPMRRVLDKVRREEGLIFPSQTTNGVMSNATMDGVLKRMKVDATPHGFRSTFRDWAGDCTDHPREIAELALAHKVGGEVERAYRRSDALKKRRALMEDWAAFLAGA